MVNEFCGFKHGVIGTDKLPADTTLNNMEKADLIKLLHTAQHNYETLMWFYNNAVKANMSQMNNNGWITCSERLPEIGERVLLWVYGRVSIGKRIDAKLFEEYDIFSLENGANESTKRIEAWQSLPEPYQPKGE